MRVLIVTTLAAAITASAGATASRTGAWGVVTRGPITPVCAAEQPCSAPARHVQLAFTQNGHVAGQVTTDNDGKYRLALKPGTYSVQIAARSASAGHDLEPGRVRVVASRWVHVDFSIDTGIR